MGFHSAIAFTTLNICPFNASSADDWIDQNLELVDEEIVLKVIRRDIVIRFNSLTFSWTALSGFRSTRKPFFAQVALSGFQIAGCTDFLFYP